MYIYQCVAAQQLLDSYLCAYDRVMVVRCVLCTYISVLPPSSYWILSTVFVMMHSRGVESTEPLSHSM